MSTGRHAAPDRVASTLWVIWAAGAAALLTVLGVDVRHPCPCDVAAPLAVPTASALDTAPADT